MVLRSRIYLGVALAVFLCSMLVAVLVCQPPTCRIVVGYYVPNVPYIRQGDPYWCGPACLTMVLNYWDVQISQEEVAAEIYDPRHHLTYIRDMVVFPRRYNLTSMELASSIVELKDFIRRGYPIIVLQKFSLMNPYGHYRVVIGYNDELKVIIVHDPLAGDNYEINYSEFAELWKPDSTFTVANWTLIIYSKGVNPPQIPKPIYGSRTKVFDLNRILLIVLITAMVVLSLRAADIVRDRLGVR